MIVDVTVVILAAFFITVEIALLLRLRKLRQARKTRNVAADPEIALDIIGSFVAGDVQATVDKIAVNPLPIACSLAAAAGGLVCAIADATGRPPQDIVRDVRESVTLTRFEMEMKKP